MKRILIVAGEASADRYAADLVRCLRKGRFSDGLEIFGTGGDQMEKSGVHLLGHVRDLASIGPKEAVSHFRAYYRTFRTLLAASLENPPDLAVLLDFPEFNLRLAKKLKRAGVTVIYYISPQIWAWRGGRIRLIRRYVDKMLVILPFEEQYYRSRGVDVEFVGHPLTEEPMPAPDRSGFLSRLNLDPVRPTVALLPGSRTKEVEHMLPLLLEAALQILKAWPTQFIVSAAASVDIGLIQRIARRIFGGNANSLWFRISQEDSRTLLANSDFAMVKSGTSTLEAALVGTPFLIFYRVSGWSWYAGRILIRTPFKGLVNLIAGRELVPEIFQHDATPEALARIALTHLRDPSKSAPMRQSLGEIRDLLGRRRASESVATIVESYL